MRVHAALVMGSDWSIRPWPEGEEPSLEQIGTWLNHLHPDQAREIGDQLNAAWKALLDDDQPQPTTTA